MLRQRLNKELLLFDGGFGTQLQAAGLKAGEIPEEYNITHPELIIDIHERYLKAGADFICTNTFGCNPLKMKASQYAFEDILKAAIHNARQAREHINKNAYIVLDIGPIGTMLKPLGPLSFDEAYDIIKAQVEIAKDDVDAVLLETMSDLYEVKAGILAIKETCDLPIMTSMTFQSDGRTLTGASPTTYVSVVEGLGVDVIGVNCSLGPDELTPIIQEVLETTSLPVLVEPNAGLPIIQNGNTIYPLQKEEFAIKMKAFMERGLSIAGGCCGTTPDYIKELNKIKIKEVQPRNVTKKTRITSQNQTVTFDNQVIICGERLNPTGKKKLKQALKEQNYEVYVREGINQEMAGAKVLDVNVGLPGIDEKQTLKEVIGLLQEVINLPLMIDSSDVQAIETACRYYNGKPLINSVNGKDEVMDAIFPIAKKYGAVVVGLTLEDEIPLTADKRLEIARKIIQKASQYGIPKENIIIDCLTLTASAQQKEVAQTIKAVKMVKEELGVHTVLGVSNVSFGLPNRPLLNRTFLTLAMQAGLDLPIINPLDKDLMDTIDAFNVLNYKDIDSLSYIQKQSEVMIKKEHTSNLSLPDIIKHGLKEEVKDNVKQLLNEYQPLEIINDIIIPTLNQVGNDYEAKKVFLPQLILSAETTKLAFEVLKEQFKGSDQTKGPVMMCTVEGDIHDIGKNIVKVVLESYGYQVIDLGKDVKVEEVVKAYDKYQPKAIGLSALMTTTVLNMERTIKALHDHHITCPIWVGGAVLTTEIAKEIGADYYTKDALESVNLLNEIIA